MRAPPPPPTHISEYPSALGVWQSPEQCSSLSWLSDPNAASGMGTGAGIGTAAGVRVGSDVQNGMHCQDSTVTHMQYDGQSIDKGQTKKSTIEYRTNDSGLYLNPKKEPDPPDIAEVVDPSSNLPPTSTNYNDSNLVESVTDGSMNPPAITPTKIQLPFSPTTPLPPHLQSNSNYGPPQSTLLRAESMPQIPQTFAAPSSMDNYPSFHGKRGDLYSFAPPPMPPRPPLRQEMSAVNLTALNPARDVYENAQRVFHAILHHSTVMQGSLFGILFIGLLAVLPAVLDSFFNNTTSDFIGWNPQILCQRGYPCLTMYVQG